MPPPYRVLSTPTFDREAKRLCKKTPAAISHLERMGESLRDDPYNRTRMYDIKKLKGLKPGEGQFRIRSGDWRLRYDVVGEEVILHAIRHRREAYR